MEISKTNKSSKAFGMLQSMTGFGRCQEVVGGREIAVELRSVNHRYFEYSSHLPRFCAYLEDDLKTAVKKACTRGKIDLGLSVSSVGGDAVEVNINHNLAKAYMTALQGLSEELHIPNNVTVTELARFSDLFTVAKAVDNEEEIWEAVSQVAEKAIAAFVAMRRAEGARMVEDISLRLAEIEDIVVKIEEISPRTSEAYRNRLLAKMQEVLQDSSADEQRILTEAAIFAEKTAVAEETVRLKSHIRQCREILEQGGPVGRKLDFLIQEFNREANTIGSKAQDLEIARLIVETKSAIEKIREQIQNLE